MFVIKNSGSYFWPVEVYLPKSGGSFEKQTFDAEFKRMSQSRIKEMLASETSDVDFCKEAVVGWKGVQDESAGAELPFSETALAGLLEVPLVASAIVKAFLASHRGAPTKN